MVIFDYNAHGQRLWVGTAGWTVLPGEDPLRFVQFDAAPTSGNSLNITNVTFNHADFQTSVNFSKRASCYCWNKLPMEHQHESVRHLCDRTTAFGDFNTVLREDDALKRQGGISEKRSWLVD